MSRLSSSTRSGLSIGRNTQESSLKDQLSIYYPCTLKSREDNFSAIRTPFNSNTTSIFRNTKDSSSNDVQSTKPVNPAHVKLVDKCIDIIIQNFNKNPIKEIIPPPLLLKIIKKLPINKINYKILAKYLYNENYFKLCCLNKYSYHQCLLNEHNLLWKQCYFEKLIQEILENFINFNDVKNNYCDKNLLQDKNLFEYSDENDENYIENEENFNEASLYSLMEACKDYIFTIKFNQFPSHLDLSEIFLRLPNLNKIDLTYNINKIGMNYERILYGMKISDATFLSKYFMNSSNIITVILTHNHIDDDLLRMLMTGLIKNNSIIKLDLSHNNITNHGARLISRFLSINKILTTLILEDNHINVEGGRYISRGLRENDSLMHLNLKLNMLGDDGCALLMEGVKENVSLKEINIACNNAADQTIQILSTILRDPQHEIETLDLSGNYFTPQHLEILKLAVQKNRSLFSIDLRNNPGYIEAINTIEDIEEIVQENEKRYIESFQEP